MRYAVSATTKTARYMLEALTPEIISETSLLYFTFSAFWDAKSIDTDEWLTKNEFVQQGVVTRHIYCQQV